MDGPHATTTDSLAPTNSVGHLTRLAHVALARRLERLTLPYGISSGQWPLMRALWEEDGLTQRELSHRVAIRDPTAAAMLHRLEVTGLIRRRIGNRDRREMRVFLTPKGRRLQEKLGPCVSAINAVALGDIGDDDVATAHRVLAAIIANLANDRFGAAPHNGFPARTRQRVVR